jgi:hypothetical protein
MKRLLFSSWLALAALGLTAAPSFAWNKTFGLFTYGGCCDKCKCGVCVPQPNAFTPVCVNVCYGCCPAPGGGGGYGNGWGAGCDGYASEQQCCGTMAYGMEYGNTSCGTPNYGVAYDPTAYGMSYNPMAYGMGYNPMPYPAMPQAPLAAQLQQWAPQMPYTGVQPTGYYPNYNYGNSGYAPMTPMYAPPYWNVSGR